MSRESLEKYQCRLKRLAKISFILSCVFGLVTGFLASTMVMAGRNGSMHIALACCVGLLVHTAMYFLVSLSLSREEKALYAYLASKKEDKR